MKNKVCFKCKQLKNINEFYKHKQMGDGHLNKCKECTKKDSATTSRKPIHGYANYDQYRQRHSIKRIFSHRYIGIKSRCLKEIKGHSYSSYGKKFLSREDWLKWCYEDKNYKKFLKLYKNWKLSNFNKKLSPSIDRINNKRSYMKNNLQWLTLSQNSSKHTK